MIAQIKGTARFYAAPYNSKMGTAVMRQYPSDAPQMVACVMLSEQKDCDDAAHAIVMYFRRVEATYV